MIFYSLEMYFEYQATIVHAHKKQEKNSESQTLVGGVVGAGAGADGVVVDKVVVHVLVAC